MPPSPAAAAPVDETAILAAVVLRERLRAVQYAGVAVALTGVVLISAGA